MILQCHQQRKIIMKAKCINDNLSTVKTGYHRLEYPLTLEPFSDAYPEYGVGGVQQIHLDGRIVKFPDIKILQEE